MTNRPPVSFNEETSTAFLQLPDVLQRGPFRLLVQAPLADPAGNTIQPDPDSYSFTGPAGLRGRLWQDDDADGVQDPGEQPANRPVFIDKNGNGKPDEGEFARTNSDDYSLDDLLPGQYTAQAVLDDNWLRSTLPRMSTSTRVLWPTTPFNGNAKDESGNDNHGIVNGASLYRSERFIGQCLQFRWENRRLHRGLR